MRHDRIITTSQYHPITLTMRDGTRIVETISEASISRRLDKIATEIIDWHWHTSALPSVAPRYLHLIGIMNGAMMMTMDLARIIQERRPDLLVCVDSVKVSSYGDSTRPQAQTLEARFFNDAQIVDLLRRHTFTHMDDFVIVDETIDTGSTIHYVLSHIAAKTPRARAAALIRSSRLDAPLTRNLWPSLFLGSSKSVHGFLVGYGLDYRGTMRHLPWIGRAYRSLDARGWQLRLLDAEIENRARDTVECVRFKDIARHFLTGVETIPELAERWNTTHTTVIRLINAFDDAFGDFDDS